MRRNVLRFREYRMSLYLQPEKTCFSVWTCGNSDRASRYGPLLRWCSTRACEKRVKLCRARAAGALATASARRRTRTRCWTAWYRYPVRAEKQNWPGDVSVAVYLSRLGNVF